MENYYYKYIKYKQKYLELKGQGKKDIKKVILFMFLGGLPIDEHWKKFMERSDENLICVVHPKDITNYNTEIIQKCFWKKYYDETKLLLVDEAHHLKTSWASKSLTDAQLMMMQYALITKGRIFKKFVLISPNDAPLYNFTVMYNELISDNKSWFSFFAKNLIRQNWKKLYKHEGGEFDFDDIDVASQWNIIDNTHLEFYFDPRKLPTYKKVTQDISCNLNPINIVEAIPGTDKKYQRYLNSTNGFTSDKLSKSNLEKIDEIGFCTVTDGIFFNAIFKHEIKKKGYKLLDHIKYREIEYLNNTNNHKQFINPTAWENEFLNQGIKQAFVNNNIWDELLTNWDSGFRGEFSNKNRIWYGANLTFNKNRLKLNFIENINYSPENWREKQWFLFENGIIKNYDNSQKNRKILEFNKLLSNRQYNDVENANKLYNISNSYTDFSLVSLDPNNVFRSFNHLKLIEEVGKKFNLFDRKSINEILKDNSNENIGKLITQMNEDDIHIKAPTEEFTINLKRHPLEYSKWNLNQIINAYNFLIFFEISSFNIKDDESKKDFFKGRDSINYDKISKKLDVRNIPTNFDKFKDEIFERFQNSYVLFQNIVKFKLRILGLEKEFYLNKPSKSIYTFKKAEFYYKRMIDLNKEHIVELKNNDKIYYIFKEDVPESIKKNEDYGIPITSFFLNNALTYGALFIRKVGNNSNIDEFSDQLYKLKNYSFKITTAYPVRPLIDSEKVPYQYITKEERLDREKTKFDAEMDKLFTDNSNDLQIIYLFKKNNWDWKAAVAEYQRFIRS